ncbi:O-antigen ligase [Arthrobacter sp. Y81]|uniref:O-antigen ligase family protein n=1 Tax=Arthrobacter sp. Y81 TaxID=2058897 RepID=UPI0015E27A03|nr:O-antigen ligase family protein [Arthrobacter sp. Y81]
MDAVTVLTVYLFLLLAIPSNRSVAALGGAGAPAALFALIAMLWWCWYHVQRPTPSLARDSQPIRIVMFVFVAAALASYAAGASRALPPAEINALNLGLLRVAAFAGILLLATDGIPNRARLMTLLRWVCFLGGVFAALGLLQFFTGQSFVEKLNIPGLSVSDFGALQDRGGFNRSVSTARNPLEYAFVLSMILPIALTLALHDTGTRLLLRWFPVGTITLAALLSVSRSAIIGVLVAIVVLLPSWSPEVRRRAGVVAVVLLGMVWALVPGMMGTLKGLFGGQDPSIKSRTDSYDVVSTFVGMNPFLGRGFGTFLPEYRILDNQYLVTLIDMGIVGLAALCAVSGVGFVTSLAARRHYTETILAKLGPALAASLAAGAVLTGFFDALSFPQAAGMLFLVAGLCGAYWRMKDSHGTERYA